MLNKWSQTERSFIVHMVPCMWNIRTRESEAKVYRIKVTSDSGEEEWHPKTKRPRVSLWSSENTLKLRNECHVTLWIYFNMNFYTLKVEILHYLDYIPNIFYLKKWFNPYFTVRGDFLITHNQIALERWVRVLSQCRLPFISHSEPLSLVGVTILISVACIEVKIFFLFVCSLPFLKGRDHIAPIALP